jgi:hypothetical protein
VVQSLQYFLHGQEIFLGRECGHSGNRVCPCSCQEIAVLWGY